MGDFNVAPEDIDIGIGQLKVLKDGCETVKHLSNLKKERCGIALKI